DRCEQNPRLELVDDVAQEVDLDLVDKEDEELDMRDEEEGPCVARMPQVVGRRTGDAPQLPEQQQEHGETDEPDDVGDVEVDVVRPSPHVDPSLERVHRAVADDRVLEE